MERCRDDFGKKGGTFPAKDLDPGPHSPSATCTSALPMVYAVVIKPISCQAYTSLSWFLFVFKASCLMHMVTTWVWVFSIMVNLLGCFPSSCSLGTVFAAHRGGFWGPLSALWSCPPGQAPMSQGNAQFNQFHLFKWRPGSEKAVGSWVLCTEALYTGRGRHMWGMVVQSHLCWIPRATPSFQNILPSTLPLQLAITDLFCKPREHDIIH